MNLTEFLYESYADEWEQEKALTYGCETVEELWKRDDLNPTLRIWIATREGVLAEKDRWLFGIWCVRQIWDLIEDQRSRTAVQTAEFYLEGRVNWKDVSFALSCAWQAVKGFTDHAALAATAAAEGNAEKAADEVCCVGNRQELLRQQVAYLRLNFPEIHVGTGSAK